MRKNNIFRCSTFSLPCCKAAGFFQSIVTGKWRTSINSICRQKHANVRLYPQKEAAIVDVISSTSTLSFDPTGVFFWPTYWVDPSGFDLFALVKCVQWHTPFMCKYGLDRYKPLAWPIVYWSGELSEFCLVFKLIKLILQCNCRSKLNWRWN